MKRKIINGIFASLAMGIIILDTKTVVYGAQEGIQICLKTIVPALFPFIILSSIVRSALLGQNIKILHPINKLCHIPRGAESILLLGFLGGYPIGAQLITQAYTAGNISKRTAIRMLGFCSNAGPAFIFGILSIIFSRSIILWTLWGIHILSALIVGFFLPVDEESICNINNAEPMTLQTALKNAIRIMSLICGWVIIFRIIICFCDKWFLWRLANNIQILVSGLLELSNGCISLCKIHSEATRFIYASGILAFGGLCVGMQTKSVTQELACGYYFPGKIIQTSLALLLSLIIQPVLFHTVYSKQQILIIITLLLLNGIMIYLLNRKKMWHLQKICSIIPLNTSRKEQIYAVSQKNTTIL